MGDSHRNLAIDEGSLRWAACYAIIRPVITMCLAAPAKVISITDNEAVVDYNGVRTTARLDTLTEPIAPGDYVLIHTGFAIRRMSAADGEATLKLFDELAESLGDSASSSENADHSPESRGAESPRGSTDKL